MGVWDQQPNVMEDIQRTWEVFCSFYLFHKLVWYAGFSRHSNGRRKLMMLVQKQEKFHAENKSYGIFTVFLSNYFEKQ